MDNVKLPLQSRVVWAGIVAFAASVLKMMNLPDYLGSDADQVQMVDTIMNAITAVSGIAAIWFRITATKQVVISRT